MRSFEEECSKSVYNYVCTYIAGSLTYIYILRLEDVMSS